MSSQAVVLIPGIKGTKLVNTSRPSFDVIWSGLQSEFETIEDLELTTEYRSDYYDEDRDTVIRPGELESLAYGEFVRDLKVGKPIYVFSYDWRMPAVENGRKLKTFVDYLIRKSRASSRMDPIEKVDFVTHSLGNLVLRCYLKQAGFGRIHKIVFTVPPFGGSLDIVVSILAGEGFFPGTKEKIRKLIRTCPGALELLPTYKGAGFFAGPGSAAGPDVDFFKPDHWQKNITKTDGSDGPKDRLAGKFRQALAVAGLTVRDHAVDLNSLSNEQRRRILVIARTGYSTIQSLKVVRKRRGSPDNLFDLRDALRTRDGDGRVPDASSCLYHQKVRTLMVTSDWLYREHSHAFILNDERVQRLIRRFLSKGVFDYRIPGHSVREVARLKKSLKRRKVIPCGTPCSNPDDPMRRPRRGEVEENPEALRVGIRLERRHTVS